MAETSHIEWTDATWNPITGCSVVSPGCTNCYAMKLAGGRLQHHPSRAGLTTPSKAGPVWTGEVRFNAAELEKPLAWRRPRRIFVCAHGDLFHESVPDAWIDRVFGVMSASGQHTFQVLTKRADRMRTYLSSFAPCREATGYLTRGGEEPTSYGGPVDTAIMADDRWPLPNVWLGVSAEDQTRADARIPQLLATPAAKRFVSLEPLIGRIKLQESALTGRTMDPFSEFEEPCPRLDCAIVGGESGHGARPMHPDWARQIRDDCAAAGVPFFFKQWGAFVDIENMPEATYQALDVHSDPRITLGAAVPAYVGKAAAGRLLDGVEHNGGPW